MGSEMDLKPPSYKCDKCDKYFTRKDNLKVHEKKYCKNKSIGGGSLTNEENLLQHIK